MIIYSIAKMYTETPGPRHETEGTFSGENFRETVLLRLVQEATAQNKKICIDLDGGYGYPTSFLEEAFGGLVRKTQDKSLINLFVFKSDEEPALISEIKQYIKNATEELR